MTVAVRAPVGAVVEQPRPLTLEEVPGATLAFHGQWRGEVSRGVQVHLTIACATRPVPIWVDELSPVVLGGMTGMVRRHSSLHAMRTSEPRWEDGHLVQAFTAEGSAERTSTAVRGMHRLGWADSGTLLACSTVCEGSSQAVCEAFLKEVELQPGFVAREPTTTELALNETLQHPREALGAVLLVLLVLVVVLLVRRPSESALTRRATPRGEKRA